MIWLLWAHYFVLAGLLGAAVLLAWSVVSGRE